MEQEIMPHCVIDFLSCLEIYIAPPNHLAKFRLNSTVAFTETYIRDETRVIAPPFLE